MRLQLALNVRDLDDAVDFYTRLFGVAPRKRKPGYANFAIAEPPLKLVLFETDDTSADRVNHLGVEVTEDAQVEAAIERISGEGLPHRIESEVVCCHARQNKVWAYEPEGLRWEWYRVLEDVEEEPASCDVLPVVGAPSEDRPAAPCDC